MKTYKLIMCLTVLTVLSACKKTEFLDKKPSTDLVVPHTLDDFQTLLDNIDIFCYNGGLAQLGSDDYVVSNSGYQANLSSAATQRNSYIWAKDIYAGEVGILDWNKLYEQVFYANGVLEGLGKSNDASSATGQYLKGWALFARAYAFYDLTRNFCKTYDANSANTDLGIPLRLVSGIDYVKNRSTLQQSFDQILEDLANAEQLLPSVRPSNKLNRPSKIAVYALFSRIYLGMRNYVQAEKYADKCLNLYNKLIDYNTLDETTSTPFTELNDELICFSSQIPMYSEFTANYPFTQCRVSPELISLYSVNDLRMSIYFNKLSDNTYTKKRGYNGRNFGFTGLATDEVYLIKSECLARRNETMAAMDVLNQLLIKRWNPNATDPANPYKNLTASSPNDALNKILLERRKELVWRGLRWHDLKRLNKEGANITLTRILNGITYTLPPNDPRYIFPIPDDEITLSGIQQNVR